MGNYSIRWNIGFGINGDALFYFQLAAVLVVNNNHKIIFALNSISRDIKMFMDGGILCIILGVPCNFMAPCFYIGFAGTG